MDSQGTSSKDSEGDGSLTFNFARTDTPCILMVSRRPTGWRFPDDGSCIAVTFPFPVTNLVAITASLAVKSTAEVVKSAAVVMKPRQR